MILYNIFNTSKSEIKKTNKKLNYNTKIKYKTTFFQYFRIHYILGTNILLIEVPIHYLLFLSLFRLYFIIYIKNVTDQ